MGSDPLDMGVVVAKGALIVLSVVSLGVIGERAWTLRRARRAELSDFTALRDSLPGGDAAGLRRRAQASAAPSLRALAIGLGQVEGAPAASPERLRDAVGQGIALETARLQDNLSLLGTVAATAPYIGLFGTVLGILSAFRHIARSGDTGAAVVAGSISEALIATAIGLGVAIPAVMAYNYFAKRAADLSLLVETHALDLAGRVSDRVSGGSKP